MLFIVFMSENSSSCGGLTTPATPKETPGRSELEFKEGRRVPVAKILIVLIVIGATAGGIIFLVTRSQRLSYRIKITIDHTKIDNDLTDFPVAIILTSNNFDFSKAMPNGSDIRFTQSDGIKELYYERERHESDSQIAVYWVKIPLVSSSSDTEFYIYYGKSDATDGTYHSPTNVWDANFRGVWHLKEDPAGTALQIKDSTINSNHGTSAGSMTSSDLVEGKIGKGVDFDGYDDYVNVGDDASLINSAPADFTITGWVKFNSLPSGYTRFMRRHGSTLSMYFIGTHGTEVQGGTGARAVENSGAELVTGVWYHVGMTNDVSILRIYLNGEEVATSTASIGSHASTLPAIIGAWKEDGTVIELHNGAIDEVRLSNVVRSAAWIKASYHSENNTLVNYGSEE